MSPPTDFPWYGLMYLAAFTAVWLPARRMPVGAAPGPVIAPVQLDSIIVWAMAGAVLGGRLGYVVLYELGHYLQNPGEIFRLWLGGMSFHGGLIGVLLSVRLTVGAPGFWPVLDRLALWIPLGLGLGRLGNFLSGELWGRPTNLPWGLVFEYGGPAARHPSQLYEAFLEGPLLMLILHLYARRSPAPGKTAALLGAVYAAFRIAAEFFREPDPAWGYLAWNWLTWGQVLSLILLTAALAVFITRRPSRRDKLSKLH